ncbi:MAG: metal-dependent hydrolase [Candidatus Bathyarchaeia archaeon]
MNLFFLGHMAWGYDWAAMSSGKGGGKLFVPAVLMLGVLPDIDLFFSRLGVVHHTFTHSLFFWLVIFAPFLVVYRRRSIPYLAAVVQHFAFGDLLVGKVMILWPFSSSYFGLNFAMASVLDVALETAGLLLAAGIVYYNGDLRRLLSVDARNIPMVLPFLALLASMLFFTVDWPIIPLIANIFSRKLLTIIVLDHIILIIFLAVSTAQGLRVRKSRSHELEI